mmetsp:Transcript_9064/g.10358  ORF Transcript_9064/g.10358 Transcript_9064/m.10358 type:complete len:280 (-) Transcript_9064:77-916(-)|eukprot:CAMPEP_0184036772 /NCGR_PEP_ID=MMETSP0955-20130417/34605_1 /TAXON_ID=627963 /ORGANISM="Aplanochytrium sp, Strain PBS07" /LENGTH=279 /DNA_ID=CAMNT_0026324567 /DNA_START=150 /DNA_END=989 /DNA_ORIENTATION=-
MDDVLEVCDRLFFEPYVYSDAWPPKGSIARQTHSLWWILLLGAYATYLSFATLNFYFVFDKNLLKHKKILKNQIQKELWSACSAFPFMTVLSIPFFLLEVRGHTKLYESWSDRSNWENIWNLFLFMAWNDCLVYWIHRGLHHPLFYKRLHKEHHRWLVPTPFASHAFNPVDGFMQSLPYHLAILVIPLPKWVYFSSFIIVNFWTISIHDGLYQVPDFLKEVINGAAHHTDHHLYFNYNHGLYFTLWDRIGGTYRNPSPFEGKGPYDDLRKAGIISKKLD